MKTLVRLVITLAVVVTLLMTATTALAALPPNMSWVKFAGNPVITTSTCSALGTAFRPALVVESANNYDAFISTPNNGADVYLATTSNGGQTWACGNSGNPVLTRGTSGSWDDTRVNMVSVIKDGGTYKMWYSGRDSNAHWAVGYATASSPSGPWTKYGSNPVLTKGTFGAWDSQMVREPSVVKDGTTYHMWYSGTQNFPYFKIGHATSSDGIAWTKDGANPVLSGTANTWDANEVYAPYVVYNTVDTSYEMFYSGENGNRWLTGHASATSPGGSWVKDANAILSPDGSGWESGDSEDFAGAVLDGTTWKVFYSQGGTYQVGLATLTDQPQLTFRQLATSISTGGSTTINIDLTAATNLYGYQFQVTYDASKVTAGGAFINSFVNTTIDASVPGGWDAFCGAGVCKFAATKLSPATPISGSGTLAQITFTGSNPGLVQLNFTSDILTNKDAANLTHTVTTGWLTVNGSATISGVVTLQGRSPTPINSGTVTLNDENGIVPPTVVNFSASDGTWTAIVPVPPGGTDYDALAAHYLYLSNQKTGITVSDGGSYPQPSTKLLGGDADNSGKIDISDLSCIGGDFGGPPTFCNTPPNSSDINADSTVNILDLVLAGGNYDLSSPQPWP